MPIKLHVYEERCPKNHPCPAVRVCPTKALTQKDNHSAPVVDYSLCISCGKCSNFCPMHCLVLEDVDSSF